MFNLLNKIFYLSKNLNVVSSKFSILKKETSIEKIFKAIENYSEDAEVRYVGGCIRKILNNEKVEDIDLATNIEPIKVKSALQKNGINFYETGMTHGTITASIENEKYEITSLRSDVSTDGRHAKVEFTNNWLQDAERRDFTINSIYSDINGNLFDPFDGKKDLKEGKVIFVGDAEKRIKEDYLRILRYLRFFLNYSNRKHEPGIIKIIKKNIEGISNLSSERLIDEFKKLINSKGFIKLFGDKESLELIEIIFPQFKNIQKFKKLNSYVNINFEKVDFIFLISLLIIDGTDNADYFLYKFKISKKDQKRLKLIDLFYREKLNSKSFTEKNLNRFFYFNGKQAVIDIINFKLFSSKKIDNRLIKLIDNYKNKVIPTLPIGANILMSKFNIPEGKNLGNKLKIIEETWVENGFQISDKQVQKIAKS